MRDKLIDMLWELNNHVYPDYDTKADEILSLFLVSKRELLNDMLMNQEEIISSPIRFNGVSIEKLKQIFEKNGVKYESPF